MLKVRTPKLAIKPMVKIEEKLVVKKRKRKKKHIQMTLLDLVEKYDLIVVENNA